MEDQVKKLMTLAMVIATLCGPGVRAAECDLSGDTHCIALQAEVPSIGFSKSTVTASAVASDDSGDPIFYTFQAGETVVGPQLENHADFQLPSGMWRLTVRVDDDRACDHEATDSSCTVDFYVPHGDMLLRRGDVDSDGKVDITDAIDILAQLFSGAGSIRCWAAAETNLDEVVNVADAISLLICLFLDENACRAFPDNLQDCRFTPNESDFLLGCKEGPYDCE